MPYKRLCITGIPTGGKSYLARKLAAATGGVAVHLDDLREELSKDPAYRLWTQFFWEKDEAQYYAETSEEEQWNDLVRQSEGFWPAFLAKIRSYENEPRPVIFESVNLLPHLVRQDLDMPMVVLVGRSFEEVFLRNKKDPRWGTTEELQRIEAKGFFEDDRPRYEAEAERFGLKTFETADEAFDYSLSLLIE
ncbi:MAG: hypothetical protein V4674_00820 [Patescibacteria group bacterium]